MVHDKNFVRIHYVDGSSPKQQQPKGGPSPTLSPQIIYCLSYLFEKLIVFCPRTVRSNFEMKCKNLRRRRVVEWTQTCMDSNLYGLNATRTCMDSRALELVYPQKASTDSRPCIVSASSLFSAGMLELVPLAPPSPSSS